MQFSPAIHGIPVLSGTTERDLLYPAPDKNQRYQDETTGVIYRWTGSAWTVSAGIYPLDTTESAADVTDYSHPVGHVFRYGASRSGSADPVANTAAFLAARATGRLEVPRGVFLVEPNVAHTDETGAAFGFFALTSDLEIVAHRGAEVKIRDGVSTGLAPVQMRAFYTNGVLSNVKGSGLTIDMNGANNRISRDFVAGSGTISVTSGVGTLSVSHAGLITASAVGTYSPSFITYGGMTYPVLSFNGTTSVTMIGAPDTAAVAFTYGKFNRLNQAHFWVSGTTGGVAARIDGCELDNFTFKNTPGTTCIAAAQSNTVGVTLGSGWRVTRSTFTNNGFDTDDHSSFYAWADDVLTQGCTFNGVASTFAASNCVAQEIHGARQQFLGNTVHSYYQGLWVASNYTSAVDGSLIQTNQFTDMRGVIIDFSRQTANDSAVTTTLVDDNYMQFNDLPIAATLKAGVQCSASYRVDGITVTNNRLKKTGSTYTAVGLNFGTQSVASQAHTNLISSGNTGWGLTFGLFLAPTVTNGLGHLESVNDHWLDMQTTAAFPFSMGVSMANGAGTAGVSSLVIRGMTVKDASYGTYLAGPVTQYERRGCTYINVGTVADESALTVTKRRGDFDRMVFTPTEAVLVSGITTADNNTNKVTLTAARVVGAPLNPVAGQRVTFTFVQDGTGAWAVTWNAVFKLTWSDTGNSANKRSSISCVFDGTNWNADGAQTPYV